MKNTEKTLLAFVVGAAAGAIAGLLIAPDTGEHTRQKLSENAETIKKDLEQSWEGNSKKIKDYTDSALSEIEKFGKMLSDAVRSETSKK